MGATKGDFGGDQLEAGKEVEEGGWHRLLWSPGDGFDARVAAASWPRAMGAVTAAWRHAIVGEEVGRPSGEKQNSSKINLFINKVVYICI